METRRMRCIERSCTWEGSRQPLKSRLSIFQVAFLQRLVRREQSQLPLIRTRLLHTLHTLLSCLLACAVGSAAAQSEDPRPINNFAANTAQQLRAGDFNGLETLAANLRAKPLLLNDGQPVLSGFYAGVSKCVEMRCGDERMAPDDWKAHEELLAKWAVKFPDSVTAKTAMAMYWKEYGWYARGLGYANTVNQDQWAAFKARTEKARSLFEAIRTRNDKDAAWYEGMLSVAKAQGATDAAFDALYQEGIARFPRYLPLYFLKAAQLSPRWGGTQSAYSGYVDSVVAVTSKEMGETMYARLNWSSWSPTMFTDGQADWPRMRRGFERLTHDYPDRWNINAYAKFACVAGDARTLKQQLAKIGQAPILDLWGSMGFFLQCVGLSRQG